jgi:hypothetical protein
VWNELIARVTLQYVQERLRTSGTEVETSEPKMGGREHSATPGQDGADGNVKPAN